MVVQARLLREANAPPQLEQVPEQSLDPPCLARARVGPEQQRADPAAGPTHEKDPGELFPGGDGEVRVALVVLQQHIVRGLVLLDEARFEQERLALGRRRHELDARALGEDRTVLLDPCPQVVEDAAAQASRLPDVDDVALRRAEEVHPRAVGPGPEPFAGRRCELARRDERRQFDRTFVAHRRGVRNSGIDGDRTGRRNRPV